MLDKSQSIDRKMYVSSLTAHVRLGRADLYVHNCFILYKFALMIILSPNRIQYTYKSEQLSIIVDETI